MMMITIHGSQEVKNKNRKFGIQGMAPSKGCFSFRIRLWIDHFGKQAVSGPPPGCDMLVVVVGGGGGGSF